MSNIIIVICFLILIIVSLCGNCLVCRMLIRQRKLCNNSTNILIGILAVSDLMMTAFNVPFTVADIILNDWIFGNFFCILVSFVQANSVYVSSFTMAVIAIDRCNAIYKFKPKNHSNDAHHQTSNANTEHRIDSEDNNNGIDFKNKINTTSSNDNHYKNHNSNNNHNDRNDGDFRKNFNHSDDNVDADVDVDDDDDDEDDGDGGEGCENDDNSSSNNNNNNNINNKSSYTILDRSEISNKIANDRKNIRNKKIQNARKNLDEQQQSINSNRRRIKLKNCSILERLNQIFRLCFGCCLAERKEPSRIRLRLQLRTRMILIISGIWIIAALHSLPHTIFNRVTVIETNKISNHNNLIVDRDGDNLNYIDSIHNSNDTIDSYREDEDEDGGEGEESGKKYDGENEENFSPTKSYDNYPTHHLHHNHHHHNHHHHHHHHHHQPHNHHHQHHHHHHHRNEHQQHESDSNQTEWFRLDDGSLSNHSFDDFSAEFETESSIQRHRRCIPVLPNWFGPNYGLWLTLFTTATQYIIPLSCAAIIYTRIAFTISSQGKVGNMSETRAERINKHKRKRLLMLALIVAIFAFCWLPFNIYYLLLDFGVTKSYNHTAFLVCLWLATSSVCYNPFVYCWLNKNFRQEAKSVWKRFEQFFCFLHCSKERV